MSARFCPQCGKALPAESRFCASCGANIDFSPAAAPGAPLQTEFLVKAGGSAKTSLRISDGRLTAQVEAIPPALGRKFRKAWLLEIVAFLILTVVISMTGGAQTKNSVGSAIVGSAFFVGLIGTLLVYWLVIRSKRQVFTVVAPLASIQKISVGGANPVIMVLLWLCLGLPGLFYYIWVTRFPAVIVHAPFVLGPDQTNQLAFRCDNQAETRRLIEVLKSRSH